MSSSPDAKEGWEALKEKGNAAFKNGSYEEAVGFYGQAIDAKPDEAMLYSNRSAAYLKKGAFEEAAQDAEKAVELDRAFAKGYSRLHGALCNLGKFEKAAQALKTGAAAVPASEAKHLRELQTTAERAAYAMDRAKELVAAGSLEEAVRILRVPQQEFPDCAPVTFLYAEARAAANPEEAAKMLAPFAYSHSNDTYYLYLRAMALYYRGQDGFSSAQGVLKQTLQMDPDNEKSRVLLKRMRAIENHKEAGNDAFKKKDCKTAVEEYTAAMELDPSNARMNATLRSNRAAARMDIKDFKGALLDCDYAINNGISSAKIYARRSRIQEQLEKYDDAVRDMQAAAEQDKQFEGELRQLKARSKKAKRKDYYKTLGLRQNESDQNEIKRAYKKACLQWHPDKWAHTTDEEKSHAEAQFKEVGEAFNVLSDPQKKRLYDSGQMDNDVEGANMAGGGFGGHSQDEFAQMMNMMFGGQGGGFAFGGDPFNGGGRRRPRGGMPGFYQF